MGTPNPGTQPCAPEHVWICAACGKTSTTQYGFDDRNKSTASAGWDESCMLNAVLCTKASIERNAEGRIVRADPVSGWRRGQ